MIRELFPSGVDGCMLNFKLTGASLSRPRQHDMTDRNYKCFVVNVFFFATHGAPFRCQLLVSQQPTMVGTKYSSSSRHHQQETMSSFLQQLIVPQNFIRLSSLNRKVFKCHFLCAPTVYRLDYYYH